MLSMYLPPHMLVEVDASDSLSITQIILTGSGPRDLTLTIVMGPR